jgi:bacterioferritin
MPQFMQDVEQIRERARQKIEDGAVTEAYKGDVQHTIAILNEALATEIVCVLRYMHHYFMATGVHGKFVADEFKEHADAEREHADQIAERIQQLGGKPDFNPGSLVQRSAAQYVEGETLADMIREDLIAERVVIEVYSDMIRYFKDDDPTTRVMVEGILKDEEEHASDLTDLLYIVDPHTGETEGQDPGTQPLSMHPQQMEERSRQSGERGERQRGEQGRQQEDRAEGGAQKRPAARVKESTSEHGGRSQQGGGQQRSQAAESSGGRSQRPGGAGGNRQGGSEEIETPRGPQRAQPKGKRAQREEQGGQDRPGMPMPGSEPGPAHAPGTSGRPTRSHPQQRAETATSRDLDEGAQGGGTRSVRVTKPNRKGRVA